MDGMRKLPSCCFGAFSSATSCVKLSRSASLRMTFERLPIGWKVGVTPSRSNSVMGFKVSMMLFRSGCHLDKLIVGEPDARVSGDIAHIAFGKMLGHESVLSCISSK